MKDIIKIERIENLVVNLHDKLVYIRNLNWI